MATEHDAPIQPGGVPRHASAKERRARGLKPFLSDLKAEVQNQLSRAEAPVRPEDISADTSGQVTQVVQPAAQAQQAQQIEAAPARHPRQTDNGAALAQAALATADHAGAEAAAARADAAAARTEAAAAQATAARADSQLQAARAEIEAAHKEFETLRTQFDAAQERTRQHILIAWIGAGAGVLLAVVALVLGFL
ncbi:hypothetical protein C8K30_106330 [Promicromonospora sp. AC04]|uniref:hypothetical protein n=1 Tax=Promicromonospora sp. AC04 TaxID=2135723 RepID=UPI000D3AED0F|nr:hypothetical protein [Promicromonospora sp. AC04]PUB26241.1 hypothetical protein C8K30_106330 [Promicromonospora sp. AC04]